MIKITELQVLEHHRILLQFSDGVKKEIDFSPYIGTDALTKPLQNDEYFAQVKIYENGRGIFWPNGYDVCPDYLRYYQDLEHLELVNL